MRKRSLGPERPLTCYGPSCYNQGIKHPAKDLLVFDPDVKTSRKYCKNCFDIVRKEREDRGKLEQTICRIFRIPNLQAKSIITGQIKNYQNQGISLKNIRLCLEYFYDIRGNSIIYAKGIGIVPIVHNEMKQYWLQRAARAGERSQKPIDTGKKMSVVKMEYPKKRYDHRQAKTIDLEALGNAISKQ